MHLILIQMGLIRYGATAVMEFSLDSPLDDKFDRLAAILDEHDATGGIVPDVASRTTNTSGAIWMMREIMFSQSGGDRPG